jgi:bifunctional enzyme CysN/CysC
MSEFIVPNEEIQHHPADEYLATQSQKTLLRFLTCGSVDDGKSSLIGRLLYETKSITDSELVTLEKDSKKFGTTDKQYDFALLVDGLSSEREQGITIDVAYRYFSSNKRKFIVADTPGHEQYTRNMATGASNCQAAVIMVDASKGILPQTKRHSYIVSILGIKQVIVAINKMDLVNNGEEQYLKIRNEYLEFAKKLNFENINLIPISALTGCNVVESSRLMPWYKEKTLLDTLEKLTIEPELNTNFSMSVQMVSRPNHRFRGYSGRIDSGIVKVGDNVRISPSGQKSTVKEIVTMTQDLQSAESGQSITLTLTDEIDISRGDIITSLKSPCEVANAFQATLLWMSNTPLVQSRQYILQIANQTAIATPTNLKHKIDIHNLDRQAASDLKQNELGVCELSTNKDISFQPYKNNKTLGGFILIDRISNETVGCGFIEFALRRSSNIFKHPEIVTRTQRSTIKQQLPKVIWLTGLSGAGKSTIANSLEQELNQQGKHTMLLDGDNIRHGLCKDLGFTEKDRAENIRRIAEVAKLMTDAGLITIVSFISPFRAERKMARELVGEKQFVEVFIDVPIEIAEQRDVKGLYKKARSGEIKNFTGINSPYQKPENPELTIDSSKLSVEESVNVLLNFISNTI